MSAAEIIYEASYTEEDRQRVQRINAWLKETGKSGADLSRLTGVKDGTRSSILTGRYVSSPTEFLQRMSDAISRIDERNRTAKADIPYTVTSIASRIEYVCKRAHSDRDFGIFIGSVGVGKTTALRAYTRKTPSAVLLEIYDGIDNTMFLQELIKATGALQVNGTMAMQMAGLIKALKGTDRVILVDEANWLPKRSFGALRRISDVAGIGVVLVGTDELLPMVNDVAGRFGQITSRIGFWPVHAPVIKKEDCALLVASYFSEPVSDDVLATFYSCCEGSARTLRNLLRSAGRYLINTNTEITPELIHTINRDAMAGKTFTERGDKNLSHPGRA